MNVFLEGILRASVLGLRILQSYVPLRTQLSESDPERIHSSPTVLF